MFVYKRNPNVTSMVTTFSEEKQRLLKIETYDGEYMSTSNVDKVVLGHKCKYVYSCLLLTFNNPESFILEGNPGISNNSIKLLKPAAGVEATLEDNFSRGYIYITRTNGLDYTMVVNNKSNIYVIDMDVNSEIKFSNNFKEVKVDY